jgi:hypothetical protein
MDNDPAFRRRLLLFWLGRIRHYREDKTVTVAGYCLDVPRIAGIIAQHLSNFVNGCIQVVIDINKCVRPQPLLQFLPCNDVTWALQKDGENLKRLAREFQPHTSFA